MKGHVKFYNTRYEHGYITGEDGKDYLVRKLDPLCSSLLKNEEVEFEPDASFDTRVATKIKRLNQNTQIGKVRKGIIKFYDISKGYGFIRSLEGEKDIFVHQTQLVGLEAYLECNDAVEYEVIVTSRGREAIQVRKIDSNPQTAP